jgi:hypothetical protein
MAEVLVQFTPPMTDETGVTYTALICGRRGEDGRWEGWIEFEPHDGGVTLRTPRETEQPNRNALEYWATGLTVSYLEGALDRARDSQTPDLRPATVAVQPSYERPAGSSAEGVNIAEPHPPRSNAVLDPFNFYDQGEEVLRMELGALDEGHLRNIIRSYSLVKDEEMDLLAIHRPALADIIVAAVRKRVASN